MIHRISRIAKSISSIVRASACVNNALALPGIQHVPMDGVQQHALLCLLPRMMSTSTSDEHQASKKSLYVLNVEGKRTLGPLLIGLMDYFERWLPNVGFFQVSMHICASA